MQDINWYTIYMPKERNAKLARKINKLLQIHPFIQQAATGSKTLEFQMVGGKIEPATQEIHLVLKIKE